MARPTVKGVEYFPLNVNFLSDLKIRKIIVACGPQSVAILIYILANIYKDEGYFMEVGDDEISLIALDTMTSNDCVENVINKACQVKFFDDTLYRSCNILSSKGIQERYLKITERRKNTYINDRLNLLNDDDVQHDVNIVQHNASNMHAETGVIVNNNYPSTGVIAELTHESKVKESKVNREIYARASDDEILSVFDDEKIQPTNSNKPVYDLYQKKLGEMSSMIKERIDDLISLYGIDATIVAVNTTHEAGGNSIKYVETVAAGNLKKEVQKANGTNRRGGSNRTAKGKTDGSDVNWAEEPDHL